MSKGQLFGYRNDEIENYSQSKYRTKQAATTRHTFLQAAELEQIALDACV